MRIRTLWKHDGHSDIPWLVAACDEYTEEEHGGVPEFYTKETGPDTRELFITVHDSVVEGLFKATTVAATVRDDGNRQK